MTGYLTRRQCKRSRALSRTPPIAPAPARNADAILGVLRQELLLASSVLEIGSGTGQHAVHFAAALPQLQWQTSDLIGNHAGIRAHIDAAKLGNVAGPLDLDVRCEAHFQQVFDAVYTCNTMHIMTIAAVAAMFGLVSRVLEPGGLFCAYGPFRLGGEFNTASNAAFDHSLRVRDDAMGIRDIEDIEAFAQAGKLRRLRYYAMPANNLMLIWVKTKESI